MKAIAVIPGKPNSIHLREVPKPRLEEAANGRGVLTGEVGDVITISRSVSAPASRSFPSTIR